MKIKKEKVTLILTNQEKELLKLYRSLDAKYKDTLICLKFRALPKYSTEIYFFVPEATVEGWKKGWKVKWTKN